MRTLESITQDNKAKVAYCEICYRWTCQCGAENRTSKIIAGRSNKYVACGEEMKIYAIVHGATVTIIG